MLIAQLQVLANSRCTTMHTYSKSNTLFFVLCLLLKSLYSLLRKWINSHLLCGIQKSVYRKVCTVHIWTSCLIVVVSPPLYLTPIFSNGGVLLTVRPPWPVQVYMTYETTVEYTQYLHIHTHTVYLYMWGNAAFIFCARLVFSGRHGYFVTRGHLVTNASTIYSWKKFIMKYDIIPSYTFS